MKITAQNFRTTFPKTGITESNIVRRYELALKSKPEDYNDSDLVKKMIDYFVIQVNEHLLNSKRENLTKKDKDVIKKTLVREREKKIKRKEKIKKTLMSDPVEKILPEVLFIKRYCGLHGKTISEKKDTAVRILASLQKSIVEKVIRKESPYASEINKIQQNLILISEQRKSNTIIDIDNIDYLREIANSQTVDPTVSIIKSFINIQGKEGVKDKATKLIDRINLIKENFSQKNKLVLSLTNYISGKTPTPEMDALTLQGLYGLSGSEYIPKPGKNVNSIDFLAAKFKSLPFSGKWKKLFGEPANNFRFMVFGEPGHGKSSFALILAKYLSKELQKKVLYIAGEEKVGGTLQEKVIRLNVANGNLDFNDKIPNSISEYDVVFIDSVNTLSLKPEDLRNLPKDKAYVFVFQTTKEGNYRGEKDFEHDVDTVVIVSNMKARTGKNRFGGEKYELNII